MTLPAGVVGSSVNGIHTRQLLADILPVIDVKDGNRVLASARYGPKGWHVSVEGFVCEIYLESKADAVACLAGVRGALL